MNIDKIKARLSALLKKARDNGSTDAEVNAAMQAAERLMEKYSLTQEQVEAASADDYHEFDVVRPAGRKNFDPVVRYCANCISRLSGTAVFIRGGDAIRFVGLEQDIAYAQWLLHSAQELLNDQWAAYKRWDMPERISREQLRAERIGFVRGFCRRIQELMDEIAQHKSDVKTETGTALVIVKTDLAVRHIEDKYGKLGKGRSMSGKGRGSDAASGAGYAAANAFSAGTGVERKAAGLLT